MTAFSLVPYTVAVPPFSLFHIAVPSCLLHAHLLLQPCRASATSPSKYLISHSFLSHTPPRLPCPILPLPPAPVSPLFPGLAKLSISRSRVYSHIWHPVLEAGLAGQGKALTPKQRLRFETCRTSCSSCPLEGSGASFCVHPTFFFIGCPPTVISVLLKVLEMVLFIAAAGFPPAETCHCWPLLQCVCAKLTPIPFL